MRPIRDSLKTFKKYGCPLGCGCNKLNHWCFPEVEKHLNPDRTKRTVEDYNRVFNLLRNQKQQP